MCKAMLKDIVDDTSLGKYDFMYLRIGRLSFRDINIWVRWRRDHSRFCQQLQVWSTKGIKF